MSVVTFFGKTLIVLSLVFQAYLLYQDKPTQTAFDKQLNAALSTCNCLTPDIQKLVKQHLRCVVMGLLGSAILMIATKCWCFKLPTLLGLFTLLWINHHQVFRTIPNIKIIENTDLWHALGVIGAILFLMGSECAATCAQKAQQGVGATKAKKQ